MDMRLIRLGRKLLPRPIVAWLTKWLSLPTRVAALESGQSLIAAYTLRQSYPPATPPATIHRHEAKVFSQNGEDGVLLYLFSRIGTTNRGFVEFGFGDGTECNAMNLLVNWGWRGVLLDANPEKVARARRLLDLRLGERAAEVVIADALLTRENVNALLPEYAHDPEPDLMSIDVDGNDYWLWQALTALRPRVLVVEYNATFGPQRSITVPYDPEFDCYAKHPGGFYHGASLQALAKLAGEKGYLLAGCESHGVNAFFVRRDAAEGAITGVAPELAYRPLAPRYTARTPEERFALIRHLAYEEV